MENPTLALFEEISRICNYFQLLRVPEFLINLERLEKKWKGDLRKHISEYFKCEICKNRQIRFDDGRRVCHFCNYSSLGHEEDLENFRGLYDCLKCFKLYKKEFFNCCRDKHLCGYCVSKETAKGRDKCRICCQDFVALESKLQCKMCNEILPAKDIFELRCRCQYCRSCFKGPKIQSKCVSCVGINMTASEIYDFTTREQEMCILCETNQIISRNDNGEERGEFYKRKCCFLDICKACTKKQHSGDHICPGCQQHSQID